MSLDSSPPPLPYTPMPILSEARDENVAALNRDSPTSVLFKPWRPGGRKSVGGGKLNEEGDIIITDFRGKLVLDENQRLLK